MNINRLRPKPGEDLGLWLSGVINDAIRDALEAGMPKDEVWIMLSSYARGEDPTGADRAYPPLVSRNRGVAVDSEP